MLGTPWLLLFYSTLRCSGHLERHGPFGVLWGKLVLKAAIGMLAIWFLEQDGHRWRLAGLCAAFRYTTALQRGNQHAPERTPLA